MHIQLPWIDGPRAPRPVPVRVWIPRPRQPIEAVITGPIRRLAVHWWNGRHHLHFPDACPNCAQAGIFTEHGYAPALVREHREGQLDVVGWTKGVVQLTEGPLYHVVYSESHPKVWALKRTRLPNSWIDTDSRDCSAHVWSLRRPVDMAECLARLYGMRWTDSKPTGGA